MKAKFGAIVTDGRGKIGGHVASKNRGGAYFRTKVTPVNRRTAAQVSVRSRLSSIASAWKGLTQTQRDSFNNAVSNFPKKDIFGDQRNPTGFNLFNKLNSNLVNVSSAQITAAPAPVSIGVFTTLSVTAATGTPAMTIVYTGAIAATEKVIIKATRGISQGKNFVKSEFRQIAVKATADTSPINVLAAYTAVFGSVPPVGQKIFIECVHVNTSTGQAGAKQQASVIIAA